MPKFYVTTEVRMIVEAQDIKDAGSVAGAAMAGVGFNMSGPDGFRTDVEVQGTTLVNVTEEGDDGR